MTKLNGWAFDVETTPNFFSVIFKNLQTEETKTFYELEGMGKYRSNIQYFLSREPINLFGYNSMNFDIPVLAAYLRGASTQECYWLAQSIIREYGPCSEIFLMPDGYSIKITEPIEIQGRWFVPNILKNIDGVKNHDLQMILGLDKRVSLKQIAINIGHAWIQDLPYGYDHIVTPNQIQKYLDYNLNDVDITKTLTIQSEEIIIGRYEIEQNQKIETVTASDSRVANLLLKDKLPDEIGIPWIILKEGGTPRQKVRLNECISPNIKFQNSLLSEFLESLKSIEVDGFRPNLKNADFVEDVEEETLYGTDLAVSFKPKIRYGGLEFEFGVGGIHSVDKLKPGVYVPKNGYKYIDGDVASFYPFIVINNRIHPEHLPEHFVDIFERWTMQRLEAKKTDPVLALILKIVVNSIYGKFGSPTHWLYDPKAMLSVTLNGQLALLMWGEMLHENGHQLFSANTDGITVCTNDEQGYVEICQDWMKRTNYQLEFANYIKIARRDVNNYMAVISHEGEIENNKISWQEKNKVKQKGIFVENPPLNYGSQMPIRAKSLREYFQNGVPIEDTVKQENNVYAFCMSQRLGNEFQPFLETANGKKRLQKSVRWFWGMGEQSGELYKVGHNSRIKMSTYPAIIANDLRRGEWVSLVNKENYTREVNKIILAINPPKTQSIFG